MVTWHRLWDHVPSKYTGPPQWYVVHAWACNFQEMVAALLEELTPASPTPGAFTQPNLKASVLLWIGGRTDYGASQLAAAWAAGLGVDPIGWRGMSR